MSHEVYLQCFERGEPAGLPRTAIRALFPIVEVESDADSWAIRFDELNFCEITATPRPGDSSRIEAFCVIRPCRDPRLWDALFAVLRLGHVVLYVPGDAPPLVGNAATVNHLPNDMVESLGRPIVARSGQDIVATIEKE